MTLNPNSTAAVTRDAVVAEYKKEKAIVDEGYETSMQGALEAYEKYCEALASMRQVSLKSLQKTYAITGAEDTAV